MLQWLGLPVAASAHAGEVDHIMVLIHWLMLVLFVGWSIFFVYVLIRFRRGAHPQGQLPGRQRFVVDVDRGRCARRRDRPARLLLDSVLAHQRRCDAAIEWRTTVRVVAEQFAWHVHYPGSRWVFGRTDIKLVSPDNPLGLDRDEAVGKDDIVTTNRPESPSGQAGRDLPVQQGRHSQPRPAADARETRRDSRHRPAGVVHADADRQWDIACSQLCGLGHFRMKAFTPSRHRRRTTRG
jgi:cytochrome c oxidase subunit 2